MVTVGTRVSSVNVFGARQVGTVTGLCPAPSGFVAWVRWDCGNGSSFPISVELLDAI